MRQVQQVAALTILLGGFLSAQTVTTTFSSTGSGSIGGDVFPSSAFTITTIGDTSDRVGPLYNATWATVNELASITIAGVGTFGFTTQTEDWVATGCCGGFGLYTGDPTSPVGLNLITLYDPVFTSWDELTPLGPLTSTANSYQWADATVMTTGGQLVFDDNVNPVTFQATVATSVPEPSSVALFGLFVAGVGLAYRRRLSH
jgi:hypothetical protein